MFYFNLETENDVIINVHECCLAQGFNAFICFVQRANADDVEPVC